MATGVGCSSSPPPEEPRPHVEKRPNVAVQHVNEYRDPETGKIENADEKPPEPKPVRTRSLGAGHSDVEERREDFAPTTLSKRVEVVTWTDERIVGVLVSETADDLTLDVTAPGTPDAAGRKLRKVPRAAIQSLSRRGGD